MGAPRGELILIRHGETAWSESGRHTGRTDIPLTARGEATAARLGTALAGRRITAARTAKLAGLGGATVDPDLQEWDYGGYEGVTTEQILAGRPGWNLWRDGVIPGDSAHPGESLAQVGARCDRVLDRGRPRPANGDGARVAHGPGWRALTARGRGMEPAGGRRLS